MYPRISDLFNDLFGTHWVWPIQSFGFMMAISFLFAAWTLALELRRKEKLGLIHAVPKKITVGEGASISDLVINGIIGFALGFKIVEMIFHYQDLIDDPQSFILSARGNIYGGVALAVVMMFFKYREKEKEKLPQPEERTIMVSSHQLVGDITIIAAISGLLGAKLFDNLEHIDSFLDDPLGALFSFSGLTFYGGLILGSIAVLWYASRNKIPLVHMLDSAAPGLILAYGIGRIGCHLAGDGDWGIVNMNPKPGWFIFPDWAWSYTYPHNVIQEGVPMSNCTGKFCFELPHPVYPTPLYEIFFSLLIFAFLWSIRKKIKVPAMLFSIYLVLNGIERFLVEQIRVNIKYNFLGMHPTQAEIIAVIMMLLGICGIIFLPKYYKKEKAAVTIEKA